MMTDEIIHILSEREDQYQHLRKHNHLTVTEQKYINADEYPSVYMTLQQPSEEE